MKDNAQMGCKKFMRLNLHFLFKFFKLKLPMISVAVQKSTCLLTEIQIAAKNKMPWFCKVIVLLTAIIALFIPSKF